MKKVVGLWQTSGSFVFKLKRSGSVIRDEEKRLVDELVNEVSFRVQIAPVDGETPQAHAMKENLLA